ncbi:unnamed protein product [Hymenolepis diminuta]|uniref:Uncharacterized protein n=1 Tax=Hymenolepis diminuta TaxID=6216 RepID=A0A564YB65_HYMDI|nr:unnamed protein product [Hymenolepis diminuta]VUZ44537.1 unnamed protein product [Hymenolepis diminuta]VUZ48832.1 unnamed protein product [Hymenolepis diminuta]VUZ53668.1 unnamed protein product [Hymenolepis diminuta]
MRTDSLLDIYSTVFKGNAWHNTAEHVRTLAKNDGDRCNIRLNIQTPFLPSSILKLIIDISVEYSKAVVDDTYNLVHFSMRRCGMMKLNFEPRPLIANSTSAYWESIRFMERKSPSTKLCNPVFPHLNSIRNIGVVH